MDRVVLKATRRSKTGKTAKALRREGVLPAVMYGHNVEPMSLSLDAHTTAMALSGLSTSAIIDIDIEGEKRAALVREKQMDYLKNRLIHIDFQIVSLTETIRTEVAILQHGVSPAVRDDNAVLVQNLSSVEVEALPGDLPEQLTVDISSVKNVGDAIYVHDLPVPAGVTVLTPGDEVVFVATGAAQEEVEEEVEAAEGTEPEVIERGKREEDEE